MLSEQGIFLKLPLEVRMKKTFYASLIAQKVEATEVLLTLLPELANWDFQGANKAGVIMTPLLIICEKQGTVKVLKTLHGFHETCHSVTFIVLVNSHQR